MGLIFTDCIGPWRTPALYDPVTPRNANAEWTRIAAILDRELPSFGLAGVTPTDPYDRCLGYLNTSADLPGVLTLVQVCCWAMQDATRLDPQARYSRGITQDPADGLREVNQRFEIAGVGYRLQRGKIMRLDSRYTHAELVVPALELLADAEFKEANREFRLAHDHYLHGRLRDCNTAALRSMESVLKTICDIRGWPYDPGATVEKLIAIVRNGGLFPEHFGGHLDHLIGVIKAGLPKIRDKQGGHGAAPGDAPVPPHIASFALHLAAANIVMLVQAHRAVPSGR